MCGYWCSRKDKARKVTHYVREQEEHVETSVRTDTNPAENEPVRIRGRQM